MKIALKGYRQTHYVPDGRRPISQVMLSRLCGATMSICGSEFKAALLRTAFILAIFGAFRVSELVPPNRRSLEGVRLDQVTLGESVLKVFIQRSKTDQLGRGYCLAISADEEVSLCPVWMVRQYHSILPRGAGHILVHTDGLPLTRYQFDFLFKKCLHFLGLQGYKFTPHSFRIGAASEAARRGRLEADIRALGRWESKRYQVYVHPNLFL